MHIILRFLLLWIGCSLFPSLLLNCLTDELFHFLLYLKKFKIVFDLCFILDLVILHMTVILNILRYLSIFKRSNYSLAFL